MGYRCVQSAENPDQVRRPDVSVIRKERVDPLGRVSFMPIPADLAVEVVLPLDVWYDVMGKVKEYVDAGFGAVWVVDPVVKSVQVFRPGVVPALFNECDTISVEPALPGVLLSVADFFK